MSKGMRISRRTALRGLGATIALPYLEAMGSVTVAATAGKKDPPRLACLYIPGGINPYHWYPKEAGFNYTTPLSHRPLEHHRDNYTVLTHLSHIDGRVAGHVHPQNWLTGQVLMPETTGMVKNTVSMDQVAAAHIGNTHLPSLPLAFVSGVGNATLSRNAQGVDIPSTGDPKTVFQMLFPPSDPTELKKAQARLALDKSIFDTAMADVKRLRLGLGRSDRHRIDQYLHSVREIEKRIHLKSEVLETGGPQFNRSAVRLAGTAGTMVEHFEIMIDLTALAFQTDMTRVTTIPFGGEIGPNTKDFTDWALKTGANVTGAHDLWHKAQDQAKDYPAMISLGYRDEALCKLVARLMDKLAATRASDGTLLDHTAIMFGGSQLVSHSGETFPMMLAGGKKLGFKHGQHLKWKKKERPASDLYLTILQQMGCPVKSFKESREPIGEILA